MRNRWHWLGSLLLILVGCRHTTPDLKPPPQPDDYTLPSADEKRYSQPYQYPKGSNDPSLASSSRNAGGLGTPGTMGGPRAGGMGAGAMGGPAGGMTGRGY
jgi:hypothetical protein